jgi:hypothetical protein
MSSHRRHLAALSIACCALVAPSVASAAKPGDTPADFPRSVAVAAKVGDTPADFPRSLAVAAKVGDTPADFPQPVAFGGPRVGHIPGVPVAFGGPRAADTPRSAAIVRPERAVVRDVDETLPIVVSSGALLLVLCGVGLVLVRSGVVRRWLPERTH